MHRVDHAFDPVIEDVRDVADGVAVREQIPATGTVTVVVEPGSENEIGCRAEEDAGCRRNKTLVVTISMVTRGRKGHSHDDQPGDESPVARGIASLVVPDLVIACVLGLPVQF